MAADLIFLTQMLPDPRTNGPRPPRGSLSPVEVPHQGQTVLCPREKVAAVVSKAEACEVLVVSVQDGQEVPVGDLE